MAIAARSDHGMKAHACFAAMAPSIASFTCVASASWYTQRVCAWLLGFTCLFVRPVLTGLPLMITGTSMGPPAISSSTAFWSSARSFELGS